jgi:hypothetical protein
MMKVIAMKEMVCNSRRYDRNRANTTRSSRSTIRSRP